MQIQLRPWLFLMPVFLLMTACTTQETISQDPWRDFFQQGRNNIMEKDTATYGNPDMHLIQAAIKGKIKEVEFSFTRKAKVNATDKEGNTALHHASRFGYLDIVEVLLAHGANVNSSNFKLNTPLHMVAHNGSLEVTKMLLEKGADIDALNSEEQSALNIAIKSKHSNVAEYMVLYLKEMDAKKN
jgi:ankyrin repeat protein